MVTPVITTQALAIRAETLVRTDNLSYVEAIVQICDDLDLEPEELGKIVKGPLKDKLKAEAIRNHVLPGNTNTLYGYAE
tara:strand:+ start:120 stop:356 length:237 start_codon:yes stop_codon:yes gene_type:complete